MHLSSITFIIIKIKIIAKHTIVRIIIITTTVIFAIIIITTNIITFTIIIITTNIIIFTIIIITTNIIIFTSIITNTLITTMIITSTTETPTIQEASLDFYKNYFYEIVGYEILFSLFIYVSSCAPIPTHPLAIHTYMKTHTHTHSFFVVEDHMLHTSDNLQTQALLDESWESALSRILAVLRTNIVSASWDVFCNVA